MGIFLFMKKEDKEFIANFKDETFKLLSFDYNALSSKYYISNKGNLIRGAGYVGHKHGITFVMPKLLQISTTENDYLGVSITINKIKKRYLIHRLVANNFISNDHKKPFINHLNGIKNDNRVENLEWCTQSENIKHAYNIGRKLAKRGNESHFYGKTGWECKNSKIVFNKENGIFYGSVGEAANAYVINKGTLTEMLNGRKLNKTSLTYLT